MSFMEVRDLALQAQHNWIQALSSRGRWVEAQPGKHFNYLRVFNGGHMVPFDVPENALRVNEWIHDGSFIKRICVGIPLFIISYDRASTFLGLC